MLAAMIDKVKFVRIAPAGSLGGGFVVLHHLRERADHVGKVARRSNYNLIHGLEHADTSRLGQVSRRGQDTKRNACCEREHSSHGESWRNGGGQAVGEPS